VLEQLIGCRLESVRLSKMSWSLEFQGTGIPLPHYSISTSADVSFIDTGKRGKPTYELVQDMLEDYLANAQYDAETRSVTLTFREGVRMEFSNLAYAGGDNSAIITNLANGEWCWLS
jgi:hypothetical protein